MDYRVELDIYNGPLDLLLYLIKRDELDIYDIPIARITDTYIAYVNMMRQLKSDGFDINVAGDFLVMAATLMEIKSAMLLPRPVVESADGQSTAAQELADPRYELVQKLLEYKRFKDSAITLQRQAELHQSRYARYPAAAPGQGDEPPPVDLDEVQIWDLLDAFNRLMKEVGGRRTIHEVSDDDTPIELHAADIEDRLRREGHLTLRGLLAGRRTRGEMIGLFLALLELVRQKRVRVEADGAAEDFQIQPAPAQMGAAVEADAANGPFERPSATPAGQDSHGADINAPAAPRAVEDDT